MSFLAHFRKKLTFYFTSRDFNFGNFVMKLTGEEVKIVTYLHVLKNCKLVKNQVIYGQNTRKKSKKFGKIEKNPKKFFKFQFFFLIHSHISKVECHSDILKIKSSTKNSSTSYEKRTAPFGLWEVSGSGSGLYKI